MRLEAADRVLDDAVFSVAGELRGSLRSILKLSRLIREFDGEVDTDTREYADYIRATAEHMAFMLNGLRRPNQAGHTAGARRR